jgi:hypothetical protein
LYSVSSKIMRPPICGGEDFEMGGTVEKLVWTEVSFSDVPLTPLDAEAVAVARRAATMVKSRMGFM